LIEFADTVVYITMVIVAKFLTKKYNSYFGLRTEISASVYFCDVM